MKQLQLQKELLTDDRESDWGMLLTVTKNGLERDKASKVRAASEGRDGKGCEWSNIAGWC